MILYVVVLVQRGSLKVGKIEIPVGITEQQELGKLGKWQQDLRLINREEEKKKRKRKQNPPV